MIFEVQGPDGKTYEVDAPDAQSAISAFQQFTGTGQQQPSPSQQPANSPLDAVQQNALAAARRKVGVGPRFQGIPVDESPKPRFEGERLSQDSVRLNIGGQRVRVGSEFLNLSPDEQNRAVDEISQALTNGTAQNPGAAHAPRQTTGKLAELRTRYPEYNDVSDDQLADALHRKFYSDVPRDEFRKSIGLAVHPEFDGSKVPGFSAETGMVERTGAADKGLAFTTGLLDGVPIVGPALERAPQVIAAGMVAPFSDKTFGEAYDEFGRMRERAQSDNPGTTLAGNVTGAVAGTIPMVAAAPAAFTVTRVQPTDPTKSSLCH